MRVYGNSWRGSGFRLVQPQALTFTGRTTRTFFEDGDVVTISATAPGPGGSTVDFGEVSGTILPAQR